MIWSALLAVAFAETWCASPLIVHEWGVTVLMPAGGVADRPGLPSWMHHDGAAPQGEPVRTLPPDSGERDLPVVHFYGAGWSDQVPLGVEVGFTKGEAATWFPAVSSRTSAAVANGGQAAEQRLQLVKQRSEPRYPPADLGVDPTRQLHWDRLLLTKEAAALPRPAEQAWVTAARDVPDALWVNGPGETERFLFYEAQTHESSALVVKAGDTAANHFVLENQSSHDVFDVVFVHEGKHWVAPRIPAGKSAGFLLRDPFERTAAKRWLAERWTIGSSASPAAGEGCDMMRDPAVPVEVAIDHRMFAAELDVLWGAWEPRLLGGGTRLLYREATQALDQVMPLSIFTDMMHVPVVHRLGVVMVIDPPLPSR